MATVDLFAETKIKPLARGKQRDSFTLSEPGNATGHLYEGTVRSAKTISSLARWLLFVTEGPPGNLAMIGKTERSLKRNVLDTIVAMLGPRIAKLTVGSGEMKIAGRTVYLAGANDATAVARIQGLTLVGFYGDEMPTWPQEVFDMARTRCSEPGAQWFGTGNPSSSTHHLKIDWIDRARLHLQRDGSIIRRPMSHPDTQDVNVYSFTIYDNRDFLSPEFIELLERSYTGMFRRRYILGEWCMAEGAIYDAWDPARHVLPFAVLPPMERWIGAGVDYGTVNPFHAVDLAIGPAPWGGRGKALYVTSEYRYDGRKRARTLTNLAYATRFRTWLGNVPHPASAGIRGIQPDLIAVDPSATSFRTELTGMGILSTLADNNVLAGIRDMASLIAHDKFYICAEGAPELIKEVPDYSWDPRAAAEGKDQPLKTKDHGLDGGRYVTRTGRNEWWDDIFPELLDVDLIGAESTDENVVALH